MNGRAHLVVAGVTAVVLVGPGLHLPPAQAVPAIAVASACALLPDLDCTDSLAARSLWPVTWLLAWALERTLGHRGALHSLLAALLVALAALLLGGALVAVAAAGGWLSHLALDACTPSGVPLCWPWPWRLRLRPR